MTTRKEETLDINDIPEREWQEVEADRLPTDILIAELQKRGYIVTDGTHYDEATGLLKFEGTDGTYFFDPETHKNVSAKVAYERASGGW